MPDRPDASPPTLSPAGVASRRAVMGAGLSLLLSACTLAPSGERPDTASAASGSGGSPGTKAAVPTDGAASPNPATSPSATAAPGSPTPSGAATPSGAGSAPAPSATAARPAPLTALASRLQGPLYLPGRAGYDAARLTENPRYDGARPLGVARVASEADVVAALRFAAENAVPLALRSGGHSYPGYSAGGAPGSGMGPGLVIDTRGLAGIKVSGRTLTVGAGAALAPIYAALAAQGRGIAGGSCATVGIAGLTLGGGVGVLTRAHGLTCDALVSARIVTADGRARTVDARHDPDLFWALRGGGGGHLGVVTSLTFSTFAAPTIKSFYYQWPLSAAADVIRAWQDWAPQADARLWSTLKLLGGAKRADGPVVILSGTWVGAGAPPVAGFLRKVPRPAASSSASRSYGQAMAGYAGCTKVAPARCHTGAGGALQREAFAATSHVAYRGLPDGGIAALLDRVRSAQGSGLKEAGVSIDALGGRVRDLAPSATAFVHRTAIATVQYTATFTGQKAEAAQRWVRAFRAAMVPSWGEGAYVNYADGALARPAAAYFGANARRLASIRKSVDPHGLFTQPQAY